MDISIYKAGISAFAISVVCTPVLIRFSRSKGLIAPVIHRSSHDTNVPNTGGVILCFAVLLPLIVFSDYPYQEDFSLLVSAFAVLLITGIIDDFNPIPVAFKFLGQFIPAIVIVTSMDSQHLMIPFIDDLIQMPYIFNYLFWIFFIVMSINAFNLIDGIDGLAIGLGMIGGLFYFLEFTALLELNLQIFSISLVTGLLGLLLFNVSRKQKIFIGDTGSLLIGGFLVFFALKYINLSEDSIKSGSFFMILGSIFIPLVDMIRVTVVRILDGNSPFRADRQHIHHLVMDLLKGNHTLTTGILLASQLVIIFLFRLLSVVQIQFQLLIFLCTFILYFVIASFLRKKNTQSA